MFSTFAVTRFVERYLLNSCKNEVNMNVQWYPGHMTKAKRQMQEDIKLIDLIIELVDSRVPLASRNPDIDELGRNKARLILLNKSDLGDERQNEAWKAYFQAKGFYVVKVDSIGDPAKIGAGAARLTKNPRDLMIAERTVDLISASRRFKDGFSFQTGAGAIPIAITKYLAERMKERGVKASFALGGIPAAIIDMYDEELVRVVACSQSFDNVAARAIVDRPGVIEIDNADYSNAYNKGGYLNREDFGVLGALEIDTDFNVNILTGSSGEMMGGLGGGPDVAGGAAISIVTIPIIRGRTPSVVKHVFTLCTPGETVAAVVTEAGIALNPKHRNYQELKEDLEKTSLKLVTIEELQQLAESLTGVYKPIETTDKVAAIVEYRDGTVLDVIRQIKK